MNLGLRDKIVLVTGGSSGLGHETVKQFAGEGAHVAFTYRVCEDKALEKSCSVGDRCKVRVQAYKCELADEASIQDVFSRVISDFGQIDILVNNAGWWPASYVKEMELKEWRKCIDINLTGHFIFSQLFVSHLLKRDQAGKIVNIVSFAGFIGSTTGHSHYASAKGGLIAFTKSLAREVGRHGIHVNAVSPGMMYSEMTRRVFAEKEKDYLNRIPLGRIAEPEEVAASVIFLSSNKADYITGATLDVSGGLLMH